MLVRIVGDHKASEDGITIADFKDGEVRDLGPKLSRIFREQGWGVELEPEPVEEPAPTAPKATKPTAPKRRAVAKPRKRKA